jgi:hypothetical protein
MTRIDLVATLVGTALVALGSGCASISDSVTSPSRWLADSSQSFADSSGALADSSNAASQSVSGSSSPAEESKEESSYRHDVRVATRALAEAGADDQALMRELGRIAGRHGVSRWEGDPATWLGVGEGLGEAGRSQGDVAALVARIGGDAVAQARAAEGLAAAL